MTLCKFCADGYEEANNTKIKRVNVNQWIKEPCMICGHPGFDYEVVSGQTSVTTRKARRK